MIQKTTTGRSSGLNRYNHELRCRRSRPVGSSISPFGNEAARVNPCPAGSGRSRTIVAEASASTISHSCCIDPGGPAKQMNSEVRVFPPGGRPTSTAACSIGTSQSVPVKFQ